MMWDIGVGMGMGFMVFFWILLVVGLAILVFVLVRVLGNSGSRPETRTAPPGDNHRTAREILEERYARGEISTEEYRERLAVLREKDR